MVEKTNKGDFVEIEFLGRNLQSNEIFDTNITEEAKKIDMKLSGKPLIIRVGSDMVVKGFDEALEGKDIGKKYSIIIEPEKAFGKRQSNMVKMIPMKFFLAQKIRPEPGMILTLDNNMVKVISVSSGRVMVDFNSPLAGKDIEYEFTVKRIVQDTKEKVKAIQLFFFGHEFEFDVDETAKKIIFHDLKLTPVLNVFKEKFKELLDMDVEILAERVQESNKSLEESSGLASKHEKKEESKEKVEDKKEEKSEAK